MPKRFDPIDKFVGNKVRYFRTMKKWSQTMLGEKLGVTFQQIQKYERGVNRIGSGRLNAIAHILGQPITAFFPALGSNSEEVDVFTLQHSQQTLRLVHAFTKIKTGALRSALLGLAEEMVAREARETQKESGKEAA